MPNPLQTIETHVQEFSRKGAELIALRREALGVLKWAKEQTTTPENVNRIAELVRFEQDAASTYHDWVDEMSRVRSLINGVNKVPGIDWQPLGAPPLVLVGGLAVVAGLAAVAMTAIIAKAANLDRQLDAIEAGVPPDVVHNAAKSAGMSFGGFFSGFGIGGLIAAGAIGFVLLRGKV